MESFSIPIANKISHVTVLFLIYYCDQFVAPENSSQQMSLQCLSTNNMVFSDENKILIKSLYLKKYTDEFPEKSWTKHGICKLLQAQLT